MPVSLPDEVWSCVCFFLLEHPDPDCRAWNWAARRSLRDLTAMLRVCKGFYSAAAPHLYRRAYIKDPMSWLDGATKAWPMISSHMTDLDYLAAGNTKLPLLRHTRHIVLVSDFYRPGSDMISASDRENDVNEMSGEQLERAVNDAILQTGRIDDATDILVTLTSDHLEVFPVLQGIQVGQRDWTGRFVMAEWMTQEQGALGALLMRKLKPKRWCQFYSGGIYAHPSTRPVQCARGDLPQVFAAHPNVGEEFVILWGTVNHVYVTETQGSASIRHSLGRRGLIDWIVDHIRTSFPGCLGAPHKEGSATQHIVEQKTRVVIYGLVTRDMRWSIEESRGASESLGQAVVGVCYDEMDRSEEFWSRMISVRPAEEGGYCKNCGFGCEP